MITGKQQQRHYHCSDIIAWIQDFIATQHLSGDQQLPSTEQLAGQFHVSTRTIHRAMDALVKKRLVYRQQGRGSFVQGAPEGGRNRRLALFMSCTQVADKSSLEYLAYDAPHLRLLSLLKKIGHVTVDFFPFRGPQEIIRQLNDIDLQAYDLIVAPAWMGSQADAFLTYHRNILLLDDSSFSFGDFNQVIIDYTPAFSSLLKAYYQNSIRKLTVIGSEAAISQQRYQALLLAASRNKLQFQFTYLPIVKRDLQHFDAVSTQFLARHDDWEALISLSDYFTLPLLDCFSRAHVVAGRDFRMASYDNLIVSMPNQKHSLDFERIQHPLEKINQAVVSLCQILLRKENLNFTTTFTVPAEEIAWSSYVRNRLGMAELSPV